MADIRVKRAYEPAADSDGTRILVDRIWPRGVAREEARLAEWIREVAPSDELRHWFGHDPDRWDEFRRRYFGELDGRRAPERALLAHVRAGRVTLVYGARDEAHNNAVALKEWLSERA
jgi:uncharacterized protein YeaO (DUF488 family)